MSKNNVMQLPQVPTLSWDDCRLLIESVVDYAIFMLDDQGRVATWNLGGEKIKGYKASEIVGEHFSKFYTPEDIASGKPRRELEIARKVGRIEDEGWRVRKDGSRFWANVVITALRDENGKLRGFGKVTRDLTARKDNEDQIRRAEQRFHQLVDAVVDYAIFMLDPAGNVSTWNSGARRVKGYADDEIIGKHFSIFYTPEDQKAGKPERILGTVRREGRYEDEGWRVRKDGSLFWANVVITSLRDDRGHLLGFAKVTRDLTDRRRAEEQLRRSEERFRLLIENAGDYAIYMLDATGHVTTWNLGAERMKGYKAEEIIGKNFALFFAEDDAAAGKPARELAIARAQGRFEDEGWRVRKDGTRFWVNAVLTALHDREGELIGFAKITCDLTARREAELNERRRLNEQAAREAAEESENRLAESEERYRALSRRLEVVLEGVADGITVQDCNGRVVFANTAAARACGFTSVDELIDTPPAEVVARFEVLDEHGCAFDTMMLPGRRVLAGEQSARAVLHIRERRTGRNWWSLVQATAVGVHDTKPELAINIWHDVTAQHRRDLAEKYVGAATLALSSSLDLDDLLSSFTKAIVPGLADWCSIVILEGNGLRPIATAHVDPKKVAKAEEVHRKFPPNPNATSGLWNVVRTGRAELFTEITEEVLTRGAVNEEHLAFLRDVGMRSVILVPIPVRDRIAGALSLVVASESHRCYDSYDLAVAQELGRRAGAAIENARLYAASRDAARQAENASRAKDEFLATVSHELRTPLNAIIGWSTLIKDRVRDPAVAKPIEVIHRNAQAQIKIIEDILDVSRVITGKFRIEPKPADLVAIAREAIEVVRPSAVAKRMTIDFRPPSEPCLLVADSERLQQVVWNLLSNAVKFTDANGRIRISVAQVGSSFSLSVADTGKGIDPEFLPFVFDRFRQADSTITRRVGGLGLGLALVRHIVELHGGQVTATSEGLGKGSTFIITLPIRAVAASPVPEDPSASRSDSGRNTPATLDGVRVLIVDDEPDARDLIQVVLIEAGALVQTAPSAAEGLEALKSFHPDVLVSDIGMPDEDGYLFIRRVRSLPVSEGGRIPALALTAYARQEDRTRAISAGFTTHIGKPVNPEALAAAIENLATFARRS